MSGEAIGKGVPRTELTPKESGIVASGCDGVEFGLSDWAVRSVFSGMASPHVEEVEISRAGRATLGIAGRSVAVRAGGVAHDLGGGVDPFLSARLGCL